MSVCHTCHTDPCACLVRWPGSNIRYAAPENGAVTLPGLRYLYAQRAAMAACLTGQMLDGHPPDYASLQAQIHQAEAAHTAQWHMPERS